MNKSKFENNIWITFYLNNKQCIGRTMIINNQQIVAVLDEIGQTGYIQFIEINKPIKLLIKKLPEKNKKPTLLNDEVIKNISFVIGEA